LADGILQQVIPKGELVRFMDEVDDYYWTGWNIYNISCSSNGTKLLAERIDQRLSTNSGNGYIEIIQNSSIYLIDINTKEENKIELE